MKGMMRNAEIGKTNQTGNGEKGEKSIWLLVIFSQNK